MGKYSGWVESKLCLLIKSLESIASNGIVVHPKPERYDLNGHDAEWRLGCGMFIAMAFFKDMGAYVGQTMDLRPALSQFVDAINQWSEKDQFSGLFLLRLNHVRRDQLPRYAVEGDKARKRNHVQQD